MATTILFLLTILAVSAGTVVLRQATGSLGDASAGDAFSKSALFFLGVGSEADVYAGPAEPLVLLTFAMLRILIPAIFVSILFMRLMSPPRMSVFAPRLFLWQRHGKWILTARFYNRLPIEAAQIDVRVFLRRPYTRSIGDDPDGAVRIETKKLDFAKYDLTTSPPTYTGGVQTKLLSLVFPKTPFSLHIDLKDTDVTEDHELVSIQGWEISALPNHFLIIMLNGQMVETGASFREYQQFRLDRDAMDVAVGKFFDLPPSKKMGKPASGARQSINWDGWASFPFTEGEVAQPDTLKPKG